MAPGRVPEPCVLAIFGASGDLTRRKLVPAIWHLQQQSRLPESFALLGLGRRDMDDDAFRAQMRDGIREFVGEVAGDDLQQFLGKLYFFSMDPADPADPAAEVNADPAEEDLSVLPAPATCVRHWPPPWQNGP